MAYAAVVLLMQSLNEILDSASYPMRLNNDEIESLQKEVNFLKLFLEDSQERGYDHEVVKKLEIKIRDAAQKAADFIDSNVYITDARAACLPERDFGWKQISVIAHQSFSRLIKEIKSVKLEVFQLFEIKYDRKFKPGEEKIPLPQDLTPNVEEKLVGIDGDIVKLLHQLTGLPLHRQVIPIVGMGGIGKTTLAQRIYNDPYVVYHFDIRAWTTIPQHTMPLAYRVREMFLGLLRCFTNIKDDICKMTNEQLGEKLYKSLKGMRYLVVLDDMWETTGWDIVLKIFFPDDGNGSRIIFTSRLDDIAVFVNPASSPHRMHFLKAAESWELLESKLFPKERCPPELVEIGKQIAAKCKGLPLAILVVAGVLNTMNRTLDTWLEIAETVESVVTKHPKHCIDILALSYDYLPNHLKACFLYMGAFPKDYEIHVSRLIWLWIAEGFVVPVRERCLEDVADDYLEDLVNRNLILVGKRRSNGRIKTCHIHDMLRDLCLREAQKENFLYVIKRHAPTFLMKAIAPRRICLHANILHDFPIRSMPLARSFLCYDKNKNLPDVFLLEFMEQVDFKLMRVLDIELLQSNHFPIEITDLIHLRYLAMAINSELPRSIFKLQKLQTLIINHIWEGQCLPLEIWKMPQLRHIYIKSGCYFPPLYDQFVLENLQTLSTLIGCISCSKEVFIRLPSLRKLEILATESDSQIDWSSECLSNLVWLNQLETLKCSFLYTPRMHRLPRGDNFPENLKKLTLCTSYLPWEDMTTLAVLPNLEVLKLRNFAFVGDLWSPVEGGFLQLKLLLLENTDPMHWDADDSQFPKLQRLVLRNCYHLREIPQGIGDIPTLQIIEVHDCSYCVVSSAKKIHEQQRELGNDDLGIRIT